MAKTISVKQREIVEAALTVIDRDGLKQFTMKNIAAVLGVTDAALYRHFPDKAAILNAMEALFQESAVEVLETLGRDGTKTALAKLEHFVKERARQFQASRPLALALFSEEFFRDAGAARAPHAGGGGQVALLLDVVRQGQQSGTLRNDIPAGHVVLLLTGSMRLMVTTWKSSEPGSPSLVTLVDDFWTTFSRLMTPQIS